MLHSFTVTNRVGDTYTFELQKPANVGFSILNIDGLHPPKATINTTHVLQLSGTLFNSVRINDRDISIDIVPVDTAISIESQRQELFRLFPPGEEVRLDFKTDNLDVYTRGYVSENEYDMFSVPQRNQIDIVCPYPYFMSKEKELVTFSGVDSMFEFPYENTDVVLPTTEFGNILTLKEKSVTYNGDASVGIVMTLHLTGQVGDITIQSREDDGYMTLDSGIISTIAGGILDSGDDIVITTVKGSKTVVLQRDGVEHNIINAISSGSKWLRLHQGSNLFVFTATVGVDYIDFKVEFNVLHGGI